jgi:hypothetical protein
MAAYRCVLDGARFPVVIAHLLPGDSLTVTSPDRTRVIPADPAGEFTWIAFHCDDPMPRTGRYLSGLRLAQNTPLRMRRVITLAVRAIRRGGAAVVEYGQVQTYPERTERGPVAFELAEICNAGLEALAVINHQES